MFVFFSIHGTAKNGEDYETIQQGVSIPAGKESVDIEIIPLSDGVEISHQYQIISSPGIPWQEARQQAEEAVADGVHGHLATITSAEEDNKIETLRLDAGGNAYWVGGYQDPDEISIPKDGNGSTTKGRFPESTEVPAMRTGFPASPTIIGVPVRRIIWLLAG